MALRIRRGDIVQVIAGDDKGKVGKVLAVDEVKHRVIVEKVNFVKRHTKARKQGMKSGIIEREAPIHLSNVLLEQIDGLAEVYYAKAAPALDPVARVEHAEKFFAALGAAIRRRARANLHPT